MSKSYSSKTADTVMVLFSLTFLFVLGGTVIALWHGELWLAFCRFWGAVIIFAVLMVCDRAWKTENK